VDKDQNLIETDLIIDSAISMHLRETAVWGKFLSIIGFVYCGLVAMGAALVLTVTSICVLGLSQPPTV